MTCSPSARPRHRRPGRSRTDGRRGAEPWPPSARTASRPGCPTASRAGSSCGPPSSARATRWRSSPPSRSPMTPATSGAVRCPSWARPTCSPRCSSTGPRASAPRCSRTRAGPPRSRRRTSPPPCCGGVSPVSRAPSGSSPKAGRPFSFYAVLGSHALRTTLVPRVNALLGALGVSPAAPDVAAAGPAVELIGLYLVAAGLLVVAGVAKARPPRRHGARPRPPSPARGGAAPSLGSARRLVRAGALAEAALGIAALLCPGPSRRPSSPSPTRPSAPSSPTHAGAVARSRPAAASGGRTRRPRRVHLAARPRPGRRRGRRRRHRAVAGDAPRASSLVSRGPGSPCCS